MLERARPKSDALGITGMLLYKDGNFVQVLEGKKKRSPSSLTPSKTMLAHTGFLVLMPERRLFPTHPSVTTTSSKSRSIASRSTTSSSTRPSPASPSPSTYFMNLLRLFSSQR